VIDLSLPISPIPATSLDPIREKDVAIGVTDPQGQRSDCCLLTALNRLSAIGYDRWETRARLNAGEPIRTASGWTFQAQADHQGREWKVSPSYVAQAPAPAVISADDVKEAYTTLLHALERPRHRGLLEALSGNRISKLKNHAQVLMIRAELWAAEALATGDAGDQERSGFFAGLAAALTWCADEEIVLLGRALKPRASEIRPFDFPEAWQRDPPTDAELEFQAQGAETREEGAAS
jgi:hypothetical protein